MPMFNSARRVRHSPEQMFALVASVENYPEFLPLCEGLTVRKRTPREGGGEVLLADMSVGYKAIRETFTSRVTLDPANLKILVEYVDGPFRYLENRWTFKPGESGCEVGFFISYEFASRMLGLLMGAMFDKAFRKFAEAFERRADVVYGRGKPALPAAEV
ncbi:type II toxin-antitoxin system RatA family toxin [Bosea sp. 685]|uniref:type II toxin-antitoxin system RatA family toxin n=1 Tax=Bosea sp. 685 TaxID=3080057 RepID=UPI0028933A1B|nr:type II toxin-antitoxin system RatA family toxin [Bosea sp. 685]WNJ93440.1 type II toxin-antitoxin system RatA family toxin [Bosea sp. 685]